MLTALSFNHMNSGSAAGWPAVCMGIKMAKVTKDMIIADIIAIDTNLIPDLLNSGMHCIGCPSAQGESLEEACMVHGIPVDEVVDALNEALA